MSAVRFRVPIAVAASVLMWVPSAGAAVPSGGCVQAAGQTTCTFAYTGAAESFKVPVGVTSAAFNLYGAQGGQLIYGGAPAQAKGAQVRAELAVTPGETLTILVGGKGGDDRWCNPVGNGGFNGGGDGGGGEGADTAPAGPCNGVGESGAGGGGGTDVRQGGTGLSARVLVAGGGGGGGGVGSAGAAGGDSGSPGATQNAQGGMTVTAASGQPGGPTAGGAGGLGGTPPDGIGCDVPESGSPGTAGAGGRGGSHADVRGFGGGGGGGGWYGGGGGAAGDGNTGCHQHGGGGGGGSSHAVPGATGVAISEGQRIGNGLITVTFATPAAPVTTIEVAGTEGDAGWLRSSATASVASPAGTSIRCSLDQSPAPATFADLPDSCAYSVAPGTITADGTFVVAASSRDDVGTTDIVRTRTIRIDATPPEVTCASPAPEFAQDASGGQVTATVSDATSGPRSTSAATALTAADLAVPGTHTKPVTGIDVAGNTTQVNCSYVVAASPVIVISSPAGDASFTQHQDVRAAYACAVTRGTVTACKGPVASGARIDTSTLGRHTFTVTATGSHGTTATRTVTYTVLPPPVLCRGLKATLLNVSLRGRTVTVDGITLSTNAGKTVAIQQNGRAAGSAVVRADGTFRGTLPAPARSGQRRASYTATVGSTRTAAMRLQRLLTITSSSGLTHRFRLSLPRAKLPRTVTILRQLTCGSRTRSGTAKVSRSGTFSARFARPAAGEVAIYRVVAPLRRGATYSVFVAVR